MFCFHSKDDDIYFPFPFFSFAFFFFFFFFQQRLVSTLNLVVVCLSLLLLFVFHQRCISNLITMSFFFICFSFIHNFNPQLWLCSHYTTGYRSVCSFTFLYSFNYVTFQFAVLSQITFHIPLLLFLYQISFFHSQLREKHHKSISSSFI